MVDARIALYAPYIQHSMNNAIAVFTEYLALSLSTIVLTINITEASSK